MQYAILDPNQILQAIIDIPQGQSTVWTGPDDFEVLISTDFGIPLGANFSDYEWDGEKFQFVGAQQEVTENIFNLTNEQLDALVNARVDAAVQKALEEREGV